VALDNYEEALAIRKQILFCEDHLSIAYEAFHIGK
jgi:hypothetical protein